MKILPPTTEPELKDRAYALAGMTLAELAQRCNVSIPLTLLHAKGWTGQLLEKALGANAANLDQPDFINLGIELKTLPISRLGKTSESTYICTAPIPETASHWRGSRVWRKMAKVLWVPIEDRHAQHFSQRQIGTPILWQPCAKIEAQLQQDWEELTELITLGHFEELSAHKGQFLQIRPKAANSKTFIRVMNQNGQMISTVPKGFYLRSAFTQQIIYENYLL